MLKRLHLENVGPASVMDVEFADRLNVFTGDNGLGKTFLIDAAWWLLTQEGKQPSPKPNWSQSKNPSIEYELALSTRTNILQCSLRYYPREQFWDGKRRDISVDETILGIYARVDGSFSFFDALRLFPNKEMVDDQGHFVGIPANKIWHGLRVDDVVVCNGLIQDWVNWQNQLDQESFDLFWKVVKTMFPADEDLQAGKPTRVNLQDVRDIPTLQLVYATVPVTDLSAGMRRILSFAYSLVWSWHEHKKAAELVNSPTAKKMFLFIDEMESHLHPQWQRSIFPAILEAIKLLDPDIKVQVLTTTHSPLVLASLEPYFNEETDKLFGFDLVDREVVLEEIPWVKLGEVDDWLTSPIFGLSRPRSKEAEVAIDAAFAFMRKADMSVFSPNLQTQDSIHQELLRLLPDDDAFWDRWIVTGRMPIAQG